MRDIHLLNDLGDASGGSEWRTATLYALLAGRARVRVWSEVKPAPVFERMLPVERVDASRGVFPKAGTIVLVGSYLNVGTWIQAGKFRRAIVVHNVPYEVGLKRNLARLQDGRVDRVELVFASRLTRRRARLAGRIEYSWIDLDRFRPSSNRGPRPFTIGRMSRDVPEKHHPEDADLYRAVLADGGRVRILGGTCLRESLGGEDGIQLLPAGAEDAADFLRSLDAFVYRVGHDRGEPFGRVVLEAMACGLPVVAHAHGGYREILRHRWNGILFRKTPAALRHLRRLQADPGLRARIGLRARRRVGRLYSAREAERRIRWYLR